MSGEPHIRVPPRALPSLEYLSRLDGDHRQAVAASFAELPVPTSLRALEEVLAKAIDETGPGASDIIAEVFSLARLADSHGYSASDLSAAVSGALELSLSESERETLQQLLAAILDAQSVRTLGKATELAEAHDRVLHTARVVTDLRPVFDNPAEDPVGAVITQRLRLSFWHANRVDEMEISLTPSQVADLLDDLSRAKEKARSLESMLGRWQLPTFVTDLEEED